MRSDIRFSLALVALFSYVIAEPVDAIANEGLVFLSSQYGFLVYLY
jgi:hypothetical protein